MVDAMPAPQHSARQRRPVSMATASLAQQAEIAICCGKHFIRSNACDAACRLAYGAPPRAAVPWLDDLADEVHAAGDGLQDGFAGIEVGVQHAWQELVDVGQRRAQPLRRFVQQQEVIDVADVMAGANAVLAVLVQRIEVNVGEELATTRLPIGRPRCAG